MQRRFAALALLAMTLLLSSCATLLGPHQVEIPLARLEESIAGRFPFNNRFLELLDIRLSNPRVSLQPDADRMTTSMDASVAPPFLAQSWTGNLAVSGQLRIDPARNALVLAEPRVETFNINGLDPQYAKQIGRIGGLLVEQLLQDLLLYTFRPDDFMVGGTRFNPTKITTRRNNLVVTFEPAR
jgi:hypothetical protein